MAAAIQANIQGVIASAQGGNYGSAALSGAVSSLVGSGVKLSTVRAPQWVRVSATIGSSAAVGGATAEFSGGSFWKGFAIGATIASANHVAHGLAADIEEARWRRRVERALAQQGGAFQEWTPEYVNGVFGGSFDKKFGRLTSISFATEMTPEQVVAKLQSNLRNAKTHNDFYYLMPDESNPIVALRPIKYELRIGDNMSTTYLVDQNTINSSRLWGNPGTIDTVTGAPTPILYKVSDYQNNTVVNIYLTVYFQSPFQGN